MKHILLAIFLSTSQLPASIMVCSDPQSVPNVFLSNFGLTNKGNNGNGNNGNGNNGNGNNGNTSNDFDDCPQITVPETGGAIFALLLGIYLLNIRNRNV